MGCGAGGSSFGYWLARFLPDGVDIVPQPNYPFRFFQGDAVEFLERHACEYDLIAASPPCQRYSRMSKCRPGLAETYPDLIGPWREAIQATGLPYVIENVYGAPLNNPVMLCTASFDGRETYRHRFFESNILLTVPPHPEHTVRASRAGHWEPGTYISIAGHCSPMWKAREAMGIDWCTREELKEAVPPCFTEYIGLQVQAALEQAA